MNIEPSAIEIRRLTGVARRELADAEISGLSPEHHRLTFVRLAELAGGRSASAADCVQPLSSPPEHPLRSALAYADSVKSARCD